MRWQGLVNSFVEKFFALDYNIFLGLGINLGFHVINLLYIIYGNALFSALITWNIQVDTLSTTFTEVHKRRQI
jgi:hypothetical protein